MLSGNHLIDADYGDSPASPYFERYEDVAEPELCESTLDYWRPRIAALDNEEDAGTMRGTLQIFERGALEDRDEQNYRTFRALLDELEDHIETL